MGLHDADSSVSRPPSRIPLWRMGLLLTVFSAVVFVMLRMPQLPIHFQIDGQLAEYLAWSKSPASIGDSFNQELNPRLFSVYYPAMAYAAKFVDRLSLLRGAFAIELVLLATAVFLLGVTLTRNALAGVITSMAVIWGNAMAASLGGSSGVGLVCNPEFPATAAICIALALSWNRRHVTAALIAGLAFNVHGSIALFGAVMICAAAWTDAIRRGTVRRAIAACALCAVAAAPTVIWVLMTPTPVDGAGLETWLRFPKWIYPMHIFVSDTPLVAWLRLAVCLIPGVLGWALLRETYGPRIGIVQGWMIAAALLLVAGYVFVEIRPVRFVAQLTLWRGTRFVLFAAMAIGIAWLIDVAQRGGFRSLAAGVAMTGFLVPMHPALAAPAHVALGILIAIVAASVKGANRAYLVLLLGIVIGLAGIEVSRVASLSAYFAPRWFAVAVVMAGLLIWASHRLNSIRPVCAVAFAIGACVFVQHVGAVHTFDGDQKRRASAILELAPAIQRSCPSGRTVVAPPDIRNPGAWANRGSFLCRQQLTVYAYGPWLVDPLFERMAWYLGNDARDAEDGPLMGRLLDGYRSRSTESFRALRERYGVGVAVVELDQRLDFGVVAENDVFRVYDLSTPFGVAHARSDGIE